MIALNVIYRHDPHGNGCFEFYRVRIYAPNISNGRLCGIDYRGQARGIYIDNIVYVEPSRRCRRNRTRTDGGVLYAVENSAGEFRAL